MSTVDDVSMFRINFGELYRRHLCRHAQLGINVLHVIAVVGIYYCGVAIVAALLGGAHPATRLAVISILLLPYLGMIARNVPMRVFIPTLICVIGIVAATEFLPLLPLWAYVLAILVLHQFQQFSHRLYTLHRDMSEFNTKYRKGLHLFTLLSIYELPILLEFLIFGRRDWV